MRGGVLGGLSQIWQRVYRLATSVMSASAKVLSLLGEKKGCGLALWGGDHSFAEAIRFMR